MDQMPEHEKRAAGSYVITEKRARRIQWLSDNAPKKKTLFERAYVGRSMKAGIKAFCLDCQGVDVAAVRDCTADACPLWAYRPYRVKRQQKSNDANID
jgi:hypothetical protein